MPAIVSAIKSSSSNAGTTTATRFPSSIRSRTLQTGAAGDGTREAVPEEGREDAEEQPEERSDDGRVALAACGRLRRGRVAEHARLLDVLREREQLLGGRLLVEELAPPLLGVVDLADEDELVQRGQAARVLDRRVQRLRPRRV